MSIMVYIDPGTGSMLFTLALGVVSVLWFGLKGIFMKLRYFTPQKGTRQERKSIVIYGEDKRYWTTFKSICDEFEKRKIPAMLIINPISKPARAKITNRATLRLLFDVSILIDFLLPVYIQDLSHHSLD